MPDKDSRSKKVSKEKKLAVKKADAKDLKKDIKKTKDARETKQVKKTGVADPAEVKAIARHVNTPPRKLRLVIDAIRGKSTNEALIILKFTNKRAAKVLEKVLKSAVANAENNAMLDRNKLYISKAFVDQGPVMKRFMARAMGRASMIRKRSSHVTIAVKEK